jgi:hypothetical protein
VQIKLMLIERKIASQIRPASHNALSPSHSDLTVQHHSLPVFCVPMYFWHGYLIVPYQFSELLILGDCIIVSNGVCFALDIAARLQ